MAGNYYQTSLEYFDSKRDQSMIESVARAEALATIEKLAIAGAMLSHPISSFVKKAACESSEVYPAISGSYQSLSERIIGRKPNNDRRRKANLISQNVPNVVWTLPGRNRGRSCGVYRTESGRIPVKMCTKNPKDFIRAVGNHCGSLKCSNCMNFTAMQMGVVIEDRIMTPSDIRGRNTGDYENPKHWVVSPPQEWIKMICQNSFTYSALVDDLSLLLPFFGFDTGVIVFHPWRLSEDRRIWRFSPHFHVVGFGMFDNEGLRRRLDGLPEFRGGQGWVISQIHAGEEMRSLRHTVGYIMTHAGIGSFHYDKDVFDIVDDLVIPPVRKGNRVYAKIIPMSIYELQGPQETGYYGELPSSFDWTQYVCSQLSADLPVYRYFGEVNSVRVLAEFSEYVERRCPECGAPIGLYRSAADHDCEKVMYLRRSKVRVMKEDIDDVLSVYGRYRNRLFSEGKDVLEFAMSVPQCSTPETKGLQEYERSKTIEQRKSDRDRLLIYVPSKYGQGYDPMIVSRSEYLSMKKEGTV